MDNLVLLEKPISWYPPAPAGCVLYLPGYPPMGTTTYDRSGQGNNGTLYGVPWERLSSGLWCNNFASLAKTDVINDGAYNGPNNLIAELPDGRLACYYTKGTSHSSADRKLYMKLSSDHGATWGDEILVWDPVGQTIDGHLISSVGSLIGGGRVPGTTRIILQENLVSTADNLIKTVYLSSIDGITWGTYDSYNVIPDVGWEQLSPNNCYVADPSPLLYVPTRGLMMFIQSVGAAHGTGNHYCLSTDDGVTFSAPATIVTDETLVPGEGSYVYLGDGKILGLIRTDEVAGNKQVYQIESDDYGATWGAMVATGWPTAPGEYGQRAEVLKFPDENTLIAFMSNRSTLNLEAKVVDAATVWADGSQWAAATTYTMDDPTLGGGGSLINGVFAINASGRYLVEFNYEEVVDSDNPCVVIQFPGIIIIDDTFQATFRGSFSVGMWLRPSEGHPAAVEIFMGCANAAEEDRLLFQLKDGANAGKILVGYESNNNLAIAMTNAAVFSAGQQDWTYLEVVLDSTVGGIGGIIILVNGVQKTLDAVFNGNTAALTFADYTSDVNLTLGALNLNGVYSNWDSVDKDLVTIYSKARTVAESLATYKSQRHLFGV